MQSTVTMIVHSLSERRVAAARAGLCGRPTRFPARAECHAVRCDSRATCATARCPEMLSMEGVL